MIYYFIWFLIPLVAYFQTYTSKKQNPTALFIYLMGLGLFVGLADMLGGYDRYIYGAIFDGIADDVESGVPLWSSPSFLHFQGDIGYSLLNVIISHYTKNRYIFILTVTFFVYIMLFLSLKEFAENYAFAILLFMGVFFFFTFTYLRQMLGVTTAWLSVQYIIKRDFKRFLVFFLPAYFFHNSAIILFPMYFVPVRKFDADVVLYVMFLCLCIGITPIPQSLFSAYGGITGDEERGEAYLNEEGSFRVEYLLEAVVFLWIILGRYSDIPNKAKYIVLTNMALGFCAILLVFVRSTNGGRLGWYYLMGVISIITFLLTSKRRLDRTSIGAVFLASFLFFRVLHSWGQVGLLYPYKTFLTDGYRNGDWIHDKYEYDESYDKDKFYR